MRALLLSFLLLLAPVALASEVRLQTDDGQSLFARESGTGTHGVLLVHDAGRTSSDWELVRARLAARGYRVLSLDLRGHGESASLLDATEPDWAAMSADLKAGAARLTKAGAKKISIVGAGLGANLALAYAASGAPVQSLILLSPGLNIKGHRPSQTIEAAAALPMLIAAGSNDTHAVNAARYLNNQASGPKQIVTLPGRARGTTLLDEHPSFEDQVLNWLAGRYGVDLSGADGGGPVLKTTDDDKLESSGKRFGE